MRTLLLILLTSVASLVQAQDFKKHFSDYTSLVISRGIDARLVKSDAKDLSFTVHGISPNHVLVENKGDELRIRIATKALWEEMKDKHWWVKVEVPYTTLLSAEALTGARIIADEPIEGESLELSVSMGGKMEIKLKIKELEVDASMGSVAELTGMAESVHVSASMGSEVDLHGLSAKYVKAKSTMGSHLEVYATEEFDGNAAMGGEIEVFGNPSRFYENTNMGGEISGSKSQ